MHNKTSKQHNKTIIKQVSNLKQHKHHNILGWCFKRCF